METVHECDRQTDGQTDGQTDRITITKTVQRRASHGNNGQATLKAQDFNLSLEGCLGRRSVDRHGQAARRMQPGPDKRNHSISLVQPKYSAALIGENTVM